jgi:magnesium-transporting ATPase (P-type)
MSDSINLEEGELARQRSLFKLSVEELTAFIVKKDTEKLASIGLEDLAKQLNTDLKNGLSRTEQESGFVDRKAVYPLIIHVNALKIYFLHYLRYGSNVYPIPPRESWFSMFWEALQDTTLIILVVAAVISLVLGLVVPHEGEAGSGWVEGAAILFVSFQPFQYLNL